MGTLYRVILTYEEDELSDEDDTRLNTKRSLEFFDGDLTKPVEFSFIHDLGSNSSTYPRLFSISLASVLLMESLGNLGLNDSLLIKANGIFPKIGPRNTVYIRIVDDKSVIEFAENSREIVTSFGHNHGQVVTLSLSQTHASNAVNETIVVNFVTIPAYRSTNESNFMPARPGIDYAPVSGKFVFLSQSTISKFNFTIQKSDDFYLNSFSKMFLILLIGIENCDNCQLGANNGIYFYPYLI